MFLVSLLSGQSICQGYGSFNVTMVHHEISHYKTFSNLMPLFTLPSFVCTYSKSVSLSLKSVFLFCLSHTKQLHLFPVLVFVSYLSSHSPNQSRQMVALSDPGCSGSPLSPPSLEGRFIPLLSYFFKNHHTLIK